MAYFLSYILNDNHAYLLYFVVYNIYLISNKNKILTVYYGNCTWSFVQQINNVTARRKRALCAGVIAHKFYILFTVKNLKGTKFEPTLNSQASFYLSPNVCQEIHGFIGRLIVLLIISVSIRHHTISIVVRYILLVVQA